MSLILFSCKKQIKFDRELWNSQNIDDKLTYELRNAMMDDLLENYSLKGKNISEIEKIIGQIDENKFDDQKTANTLIYTVLIKWRGIDPVYYKYLNLHYKNNIIDSIYITERKSN